jgi:hypothetical protein
MDTIIDGIGAEVAETEKELRTAIIAEFENRISELRGEIGKLRGEVNVSNGVISFDKWRNTDAA